MKKSRWLRLVVGLVAATALMQARQPGEPPKPGFNLFSKQQDIQLGQEASAEVRQKVTVIQNQFLQNYLQRVGKRLAAQPEAGDWPFNFTLVLDPGINAFALPGGPMYVDTGAIVAVNNEAQLAGVMAHEMSHVILRHGTNQVSKANLLRIPAALVGAVVGNGSLLGQLAQVGIGLGFSSVLLSYSREAESEADALGARIMSEAGYNPLELARFFEKIEGLAGSHTIQFLSDHPNPGNREKDIEAEVRTFSRRQYGYETGEFQRAKTEIAQLPKSAGNTLRGVAHSDPAAGRPSGQFQRFQGRSFSMVYAANWHVFGEANSDSVTIAPREGVVQSAKGSTQIGYGVIASYFLPDRKGEDLRSATGDLIRHLVATNPGMQNTGTGHTVHVEGIPGLVTILASNSALTGGPETDALLTMNRSDGVFYMVFIAPTSEFRNLEKVYDQIVQSVKFR